MRVVIHTPMSSDVKLMTMAESEISEPRVGFMGTMNSLFLKKEKPKTDPLRLARRVGRTDTETDADQGIMPMAEK
jgi:hypothetical protein